MESKTSSDSSLGRTLGEDASHAARAVESAARDEFSRVKRMIDTGKERAVEWREGVETNIRSKPIQSVLIAAAVGAVVGILVSRRH